jgi:hypothetical protein
LPFLSNAVFSEAVKKKIFWIGYSRLHFSVAACLASFAPDAHQGLVLLAKTDRFLDPQFEGFKVFRTSSKRFILITLYAIFTRSQVWACGISPNTTTSAELYCFRLLGFLKKLYFYDDGLAGCISDTYVWRHTRSILPKSTGSITWDYTAFSKEFRHAPTKIPLKYLKALDHLKLIPATDSQDNDKPNTIVFIEAQACDQGRLFDHFLSNVSNHDRAFYFPHLGKNSVFSTYTSERLRLDEYNKSSHSIDIHGDVGSLEAALISMIESSASVDIYCGCTSTLLLVLAYFQAYPTECRLRIFVSPSSTNVMNGKASQSKGFYDYLNDVYSPSFSFIFLLDYPARSAQGRLAA